MTNLEYKTIMALIDTCIDTKVITGNTYHYTCNASKLKEAIKSIYEKEVEKDCTEDLGNWLDDL